MTCDPAVALAGAEQHIGHPIGPRTLRKMAESVREEARRHEDAAGRAHNKADYYDDLATQREQERAGATT